MNFTNKKFAIGTAQFGMIYGIANKSGQVTNEEIKNILSFCVSNNINTIDTAISYGDSENLLGKNGVNHFQIITKLPAIPKNTKNIKKWINDSINDSILRLNVSNLYGLLLHSPLQLLEETGDIIYDELIKCKESGKISKIGISVYEPIELHKILNIYKVDIVQLPLNIFDRRFEQTNWLKKLKANGIEIHVRSIFLQGLLLMKPDERPIYFSKWKNLFNEYDNWLLLNKYCSIKACLNFALSFPEIDKIIFGVDSLTNLKQIINSVDRTCENFPGTLISNELDLINPALWHKK
jgi:aryl-alcohol dehydrogenase-like predicted oxidoreductase